MAQILIKILADGWNIGHQSKKKKDTNSLSKKLNYITDNNLEVMFPYIKK